MKDFIRPEGVYVSTERSGLEPYLVTIERVNGDCSITSLSCTENEAKSLVEQLEKVFKLDACSN